MCYSCYRDSMYIRQIYSSQQIDDGIRVNNRINVFEEEKTQI